VSRRATVPIRAATIPAVPDEAPAERLRQYRQAGMQPNGATLLHEQPAVDAFDRWLESKGTSIQAWSTQCAAHNRPPTLTVAFALGYISDRLDGTIKPDSVAQRFAHLVGALARKGWDVSAVRAERDKRHSAMTTMFRAARAGMHTDDVRRTQVRARPLTIKVITSMMDRIQQLEDSGDVSEMWAVWMRGFVLFGFAAALRINEIARLEWSWCTFDARGLVIDIPSSKRDRTAKRVVIPRGANLCPVAALEALRDAYDTRGTNTSRVFATPVGRRARNDTPWVDGIEASLASPTFHPEMADDFRHAAAVRAARCRLDRHLDFLLEASGVKARSVFERPSSHGLRRGCATELANAGVSLLDIAKHLRHASPTVTSIYIEGADLHVVDPARPAKRWSKADERALQAALSDVAGRLGTTTGSVTGRSTSDV
jgi:integrase